MTENEEQRRCREKSQENNNNVKKNLETRKYMSKVYVKCVKE